MKKFSEHLNEGYNDNRTGFAKRRREDDEYHVPDPTTTTHKIVHRVSHPDVEGGKEHNRTVTISNTTKSRAEAHVAAKTHLQSKGYKIHEETDACPVCGQTPCNCTHLTEGAYEKAEENKKSADAAKKQGDMFAHHLHMADHHDNMAEWHASKGRHGEADRHAEKSEQHHEKAMSLKEEAELDEARMTAAMKLQKAFQREQEKSVASRERAKELLQPKKEEPKKVEEGLKPEHNMRPGWMLKADPELAKKVADNKKKFKSFKDTVGKKIENK